MSSPEEVPNEETLKKIQAEFDKEFSMQKEESLEERVKKATQIPDDATLLKELSELSEGVEKKEKRKGKGGKERGEKEKGRKRGSKNSENTERRIVTGV